MATMQQAILLSSRVCPEHACVCNLGRSGQNQRRKRSVSVAFLPPGWVRLPWKQEQTLWAPTVCSEHFHFLSITTPGGSCCHLAISCTTAPEEMEPGQGHSW